MSFNTSIPKAQGYGDAEPAIWDRTNCEDTVLCCADLTIEEHCFTFTGNNLKLFCGLKIERIKSTILPDLFTKTEFFSMTTHECTLHLLHMPGLSCNLKYLLVTLAIWKKKNVLVFKLYLTPLNYKHLKEMIWTPKTHVTGIYIYIFIASTSPVNTSTEWRIRFNFMAYIDLVIVKLK